MDVGLGSFICPFCRDHEETMAHTLFCCTRAEGIWKSGYSWIKLDIALPGDVRMHYWQYTPFPRRKNLQSRWRILWCGVTWVLWNNRNNIIFRGKVFPHCHATTTFTEEQQHRPASYLSPLCATLCEILGIHNVASYATMIIVFGCGSC